MLVKLWKSIAESLETYKNFPRIVGETGGKDFIFVHSSADVREVVIAILRGAFESQGQKCSAVSRVFVPRSLWEDIKIMLIQELNHVKVGDVGNLENFMGAVISKEAFDRIVGYIEEAKQSDEYEIVYGGTYDDSEGWFVYPTVILSHSPDSKLMREEIFGPVVTVYVYDDEDFEKMLDICDSATEYGLTGSIFARDRYAIELAEKKLRYTAGNFYINDKPTGAIVDRQPFGGARHSGTDDKAGSYLNLLRWLSPRTIKETFVPPTEWRRPFMT